MPDTLRFLKMPPRWSLALLLASSPCLGEEANSSPGLEKAKEEFKATVTTGEQLRVAGQALITEIAVVRKRADKRVARKAALEVERTRLDGALAEAPEEGAKAELRASLERVEARLEKADSDLLADFAQLEVLQELAGWLSTHQVVDARPKDVTVRLDDSLEALFQSKEAWDEEMRGAGLKNWVCREGFLCAAKERSLRVRTELAAAPGDVPVLIDHAAMTISFRIRELKPAVFKLTLPEVPKPKEALAAARRARIPEPDPFEKKEPTHNRARDRSSRSPSRSSDDGSGSHDVPKPDADKVREAEQRIQGHFK